MLTRDKAVALDYIRSRIVQAQDELKKTGLTNKASRDVRWDLDQALTHLTEPTTEAGR